MDETTTKISIGVITAILTTLTVLGITNLADVPDPIDDAYYCEDRSIVMRCDSLSQYYKLPNGKCWNSEYGNKLCRSGWVLIDQDNKKTIEGYDRVLYFNKLQDCSTRYYNTTEFHNRLFCYEEANNETTHKYFCGWNKTVTRHNETNCYDSGKFNLTISYKDYKEVYNYICDYSKWGKCYLEDNHVCCEAKHNDLNDGKCSPGEEYVILFEDPKTTLLDSTKVNKKYDTFDGFDIKNNDVKCVLQ